MRNPHAFTSVLYWFTDKLFVNTHFAEACFASVYVIVQHVDFAHICNLLLMDLAIKLYTVKLNILLSQNVIPLL